MSEPVTQACPSCGKQVTMVPYDIGSGPEMSCPNCEWCWGADGQDLDPDDPIKYMPPPLRGRYFRIDLTREPADE